MGEGTRVLNPKAPGRGPSLSWPGLLCHCFVKNEDLTLCPFLDPLPFLFALSLTFLSMGACVGAIGDPDGDGVGRELEGPAIQGRFGKGVYRQSSSGIGKACANPLFLG